MSLINIEKLGVTKLTTSNISSNGKAASLMSEFASLKTIKDIEAFSKKYGLLGIKHPDSER